MLYDPEATATSRRKHPPLSTSKHLSPINPTSWGADYLALPVPTGIVRSHAVNTNGQYAWVRSCVGACADQTNRLSVAGWRLASLFVNKDGFLFYHTEQIVTWLLIYFRCRSLQNSRLRARCACLRILPAPLFRQGSRSHRACSVVIHYWDLHGLCY